MTDQELTRLKRMIDYLEHQKPETGDKIVLTYTDKLIMDYVDGARPCSK